MHNDCFDAEIVSMTVFAALFVRSHSTCTEKAVYELEIHKYLLLTEFEGRTVSYGPSFFPFAYGPSAKRAGHKLTRKNQDP